MDIDECSNPNACHASAKCINIEGGFTCVCEDGLVGDPLSSGCRKPGDCFTNEDCPISAACYNNTCRNPCETPGACGINAECIPLAHEATCKCPLRTKEDNNHNCIPVDCIAANDCSDDKTCLNSTCINPCKLPNICGEKAYCSPSNHLGICICEAGTTGDAYLGCLPFQYCADDFQCPSGSKCSNGLCSSQCTNARECLTDQLCIQGICQPTCKSNSSCPENQYCQNNVCIQDQKCRTNNDCADDEKCLSNAFGQKNCVDACEEVHCGRNAECYSKNHTPSCYCKVGFKGDPTDDKLGCKQIECENNEQCSKDKLCDQYMCKIACLVHNPCGKNTLCSAEHHKQTCYCQPGYTGDPNVGCHLINFCADQPCAPGAACHNSRGSFKCTCPHGSVGDPYNEGCRPSFECKTNSDCPNEAACDKNNGIYKCKDVCENTICGINSECIAVDHVGHCTCRDGYSGDPSPQKGCKPKLVSCKETADCPANTYCYGEICTPPCQNSEECQNNEVCLQGQCLNACTIKSSCGMNAECEINKHLKTCRCPPGFTGNPDVECFRCKYIKFLSFLPTNPSSIFKNVSQYLYIYSACSMLYS